MDHTDNTLHEVQITASRTSALFEIDDEPVHPKAISAYTVSQRPHEPAHVVLYLEDHRDTRFHGMARVSIADAPDPGPAAAVFLAAIDAEELERTALTRLDLGTEPHSLTKAMLLQLQEWARGA